MLPLRGVKGFLSASPCALFWGSEYHGQRGAIRAPRAFFALSSFGYVPRASEPNLPIGTGCNLLTGGKRDSSRSETNKKNNRSFNDKDHDQVLGNRPNRSDGHGHRSSCLEKASR